MMWRDGEVLDLTGTWGAPGRRCAEFRVRLTASPAGAAGLQPATEVRAVAYEALTGLPRSGERVRLEVSALDRALGTGGHAMIAARLEVLNEDPPRQGHLVKVRYMPDQVMVAGVDEQGTAHHDLLSAPADELGLDGCPVVVADLHSSLPAIVAGIRSCATTGAHDLGPSAGSADHGGVRKDSRRMPRVVYVMSDGGALPLAYSRTVAGLQEAGWIAATVTAGQAWGGDVEAVSIHNALLAARHVLGAEVVVLIQGPGNLGTDTPWGFSGVACGDAVNAVATLKGRAVACLRVSQADPRPRHRGVSHHSMTAYGRVALAAADVVVPALPGELGRQVDAQARALCAPRPLGARHRRIDIPLDGLAEALTTVEALTGVRLSTMGRGLKDDEAAFLAAAAAGRHAASLLGPGGTRGAASG